MAERSLDWLRQAERDLEKARLNLQAFISTTRYQGEPQILSWQQDLEKKAIAENLDGSYGLRTDRQDLTADEIWRTYMLLTRVEAAFRSMKSPLWSVRFFIT